jgi:hypothetical protein
MVAALDPITPFIVFAFWLFVLSLLFRYLFKKYSITENPERNGEIFGAILAIFFVLINVVIENYSLLSGMVFAFEIIVILFIYGCWILLKRYLN